MSRLIICLTGPARSGKTVAAHYLVDRHGFERVRFAGPLKAMLAALGLTQEEIEGDAKERPCALLGGKTPRHAMQTMGTEWGREMIYPDLWVNAWRHAVGQLPAGKPVVVDDCRFHNEAAAIRALDGVIVRVARPGAGIGGGHVSELQTLEADLDVRNTGPLDLFCIRLDELVSLVSRL